MRASNLQPSGTDLKPVVELVEKMLCTTSVRYMNVSGTRRMGEGGGQHEFLRLRWYGVQSDFITMLGVPRPTAPPLEDLTTEPWFRLSGLVCQAHTVLMEPHILHPLRTTYPHLFPDLIPPHRARCLSPHCNVTLSCECRT
jgi:hypothetical protein